MRIVARNVHTALPEALFKVRHHGLPEDSRNGPVYVLPVPVDTLYTHPTERVLFWSQRDANPFFHFFEGLWMIEGRNDVAFLTQFAKQIAQYSDDGKTFHGAYGQRWRYRFNEDQLSWIIKRFKANPNDRRIVLTMWDPNIDIRCADMDGKDVPCNTQIYFRISKYEGKTCLNMKVNCRSNDILWGAYGANAVHLSMLQEYLALNIGVEVGWYIQSSFNWHAYKDFLDKVLGRPKQFPKTEADDLTYHAMQQTQTVVSPYEVETSERPKVEAFKMIEDPERWEEDIATFFAIQDGLGEEGLFHEPFFKSVALPLLTAHRCYKLGNYDDAFRNLEQCHASDWRIAAREWLQRRQLRSQSAYKANMDSAASSGS